MAVTERAARSGDAATYSLSVSLVIAPNLFILKDNSRESVKCFCNMPLTNHTNPIYLYFSDPFLLFRNPAMTLAAELTKRISGFLSPHRRLMSELQRDASIPSPH